MALASFKHVGDLQALSVSKSCTEFAPGLVWAFLSPRPGYVPKVLSTSFRSQVVVLQAFSPSSSSEGDDRHLLCPVRALKMYVDHSSQWRKSLHLLVCFGAGRKGRYLAPSANELPWFYNCFRQLSHLGVFPLLKATQYLIPYSENMGNVSNPRRFQRCQSLYCQWSERINSLFLLSSSCPAQTPYYNTHLHTHRQTSTALFPLAIINLHQTKLMH